MASPTVVFVPGLREHVPDHWQTLLQARIARSACVPRLGKGVLSCAAWVEAIDKTVGSVEGPVVLVGHSAGVAMIAHWARRYRRPVRGAILATPPDLERELPAGYPTKQALAQNGWMPVPSDPLPFESVLVASANDPLCALERAAQFAMAWDARFESAGAVGHLNPASGFGEWPRAPGLLAEFGVEVDPRAAVAWQW
ncbi:MAG TPA: alpha/beta fold hydrolase [Usitatibacter sp.]|nr:alpha/beta fold hydrolase [Usitatibacter sp.]